MAKISAPNKQYNGISACINFINGIGETDVWDRINWFKENGYTVEEDVITDEKEVPDFELENMTVDELIAFAQENSIDIGKSTSKASIIKKIVAAGQSDDGGDSDDNEG